ncbi:phage tail domain-containing protein [Kribbella sindirgiensis]|uniref:Minor tail protein n=1 Tax=Kribbella sindirgiensis TaxID=1124744 RepID=A0A4R0I678_9ACTN|nr:phage tail domain-containing protein [Kribbella sindirgiensis]TCC19965.1 hypothetical protein E0H50_37710 [Kribbella sindirgiensis]
MADDPIYQALPTEARGAQALSGVTGLGLPDLSTQWVEGAGDGATFRGQRALPRDIDLPLYFDGGDRAGLKALSKTLSTILAGECELRIVDEDGSYWFVNVRRVGGGQYVYGADTTGERDLMTVITMRAGDPYWTSSHSNAPTIKAASSTRGLLQAGASLTALKLKPSQALGSVVLENLGDAPAWPRWEVVGPGDNFVAISPAGEVLNWTGALLDGEVLTIDTKTAKVTDNHGVNRFSEMGPAPRMWKIPPGIFTAQVSLNNPGSGGQQRVNPRLNYVTNGMFELGITGYAATTSTNPVVISWSNPGSGGQKTLKAVVPANGSPQVYYTVTGLTPGRTYILGAAGFIDEGDSGPAYVKVSGTASQRSSGPGKGAVQMSTQFVATSTSHVIELWGAVSPTVATTTLFDSVYVGEDSQYFDGDTPDTLTNEFEWTGTPYASTSRKWDLIQSGESLIRCIWQDRKQMVI